MIVVHNYLVKILNDDYVEKVLLNIMFQVMKMVHSKISFKENVKLQKLYINVHST